MKKLILATVFMLIPSLAFATVDRMTNATNMTVTPTGSSTSDSLGDWLAAFPSENIVSPQPRIVTGTSSPITSADKSVLVIDRNNTGVAHTVCGAGTTGCTSGFTFGVSNEGSGDATLTSSSMINGSFDPFVIRQNDGCWLSSIASTYYGTDYSTCPAKAYNANFSTGSMTALDSRITVTNATTGVCSYWDVSGVLQYTATGGCAGRITYDPLTHALEGLVREKATTNLKRKSANIINQATYWATVSGLPTFDEDAAAAPDGTNTFALMTRTTTAASTLGGTGSISAGQKPMIATVFGKKGVGSTGYLALRLQLSTYSNRVDATCNLNDCTISGVRDYGTSDTYGFTFVQDVGNGVCRCGVGATLIDDTATSFTQLFSPVSGATNDVDSSGQTIGDSVYLWGAQVEASTYPTSYIPTDTTQVTREADVVSISSPYWLNSSVGTVCMDFKTKSNASSLVLASSTGADRSLLLFRSATGAGSYDGTNAADYNLAFADARTENKSCIKFSGTSSNVAINGTLGTAQTFDGSFNIGSAIKLFEDYNGANDVSGTIRRVRSFPFTLTDAEMVTNTQ